MLKRRPLFLGERQRAPPRFKILLLVFKDSPRACRPFPSPSRAQTATEKIERIHLPIFIPDPIPVYHWPTSASAPTSCVLPCFQTFLSREPLSTAAPRDDGPPPFCISTSYWQIGPGTRPTRSGSAALCQGSGSGPRRSRGDPLSLSLFLPLPCHFIVTFHEMSKTRTYVSIFLVSEGGGGEFVDVEVHSTTALSINVRCVHESR